MKVLPLQLGPEKILFIDYSIIRNMGTKDAWKTTQNNKQNIMSLKPILEKNLEPQMHIHIRIIGKDFFKEGSEEQTFDVDTYINLNSFYETLIKPYLSTTGAE